MTSKTKWDCAIGTPEEDHEFKIHYPEEDVGFAGYKECIHCGKQEALTEADFDDFNEYPDDYDN